MAATYFLSFILFRVSEGGHVRSFWSVVCSMLGDDWIIDIVLWARTVVIAPSGPKVCAAPSSYSTGQCSALFSCWPNRYSRLRAVGMLAAVFCIPRTCILALDVGQLACFNLQIPRMQFTEPVHEWRRLPRRLVRPPMRTLGLEAKVYMIVISSAAINFTDQCVHSRTNSEDSSKKFR